MTPTTLVCGGTGAAREAAIAAAFRAAIATEIEAASTAPPTASERRAVALLEGLADGRGDFQLSAWPQIQVIRIAAGCPCCIGNLTLRVTLNRILRHPPVQLYIGLASGRHLPQIRDFLSQPAYRELLRLNPDIRIDSNS